MTESVTRQAANRRLPAAVRTAWGKAAVAVKPSSALIIPVLDAEAAVCSWLGRTSVDFDGAPLHVTAMFPFLPSRGIDAAQEARVATVAAQTARFRFALAHIDRFPGVIYLAPRPAEPFVELTRHIQRLWPQCQPYGGVFDGIIPHVTVAFADRPPADLEVLERALPLQTEATEIWLIEQTVRGWRTRTTFPLGEPNDGGPAAG